MSTLIIAGNLTRDPELRNVNGGRSVVTFSVAENRRWADKDSGATQEAVTYLDVTAWGAMAEHVATSLRTGDRALVTGRLEQRSWEGTDGQLPHQARARRHRRRSQPALRRGLHHPGRPARPRRGRRPELSISTTPASGQRGRPLGSTRAAGSRLAATRYEAGIPAE